MSVFGFSIRLLDFLYPPHCRYCNVFILRKDIFCRRCSAKIRRVSTLSLPITKKYTLKTFAACAYQEPVKGLIYKKFAADTLASKQLATLVLDHTNISSVPIDYLVPIPLHWTRYAQRGFNQAFIMANELSKKLNVPVISLLKRVKRTNFQSSIPVAGRVANLKGAFVVKRAKREWSRKILRGKTILLVDDLLTTGATLQNAARALIACKPRNMLAAVAARTC